MKRYIAQFVRGGFPELYAVLDTHEGWQISEPMPYHDALERARDLNREPKLEETNVDWSPLTGWLGGLNLPTQP